MKRSIFILLLCLATLAVFLFGTAFACSTYKNTLSAKRSSYPLDGDDCYATTYGTQCGSTWNNYLSAKVRPYYRDSQGNVVGGVTKTKAINNASSVQASSTCKGNTGVYAKSWHTNYCYQYGCLTTNKTRPQILCDNVVLIDNY
ncbi:MAG: hypothetical protein PHZ11_10455 [Desulfitobacteriaceae bacterium]|nr:hypothetical protein [Desulfitobacteriaceae bacterium]